MKKKAFIATALALTLGVSGLTACGGKKTSENSEADLEIFYRNLGDGTAWLDNLIVAFEAKYPECNVVKTYVESSTGIESALVNPEVNTVDLYIASLQNLLAYTEYLEPLNDIVEMDVDGKGVTIKEKHGANVLSFNSKNDTVYATTYGGGVCGLVYNKTAFEELGYEIPRTTDELASLAADMVDDKQTPFIYCGNADYWTFFQMTLAGQYGGIEEINNYWTATYVDPDTGVVEQPSLKAMITEGRKQALIAFEDCVAPRGYAYGASNTTTHTDAQTLFLAGEALMMPNGSWLENEMRNTRTDIEYAFMKTPIISALGDKLGISDRVLAEVVSYVDSADYAAGKIDDNSEEYNAQIVSTCSQEIIDRVADARKITFTEASSGKCFIPNYAKAKEWAKKFIQFMNTDEGLGYYINTLHSPTLVSPTTEIDTTGWSTFMKSAYDMLQGAEIVFRAKGYELFYNNAIEWVPNYPQDYILAEDEADRISAEEYWDDVLVPWYEDNWDLFLLNAGLKTTGE